MNQNNRRDTNTEIPDWKCERFLLNELDDAEMERIRRAAAEDEHLRARLDALARSNREILGEYPAGWMGNQIREKLGRHAAGAYTARRGGRFRLALVPAGLVALTVLAIFVLPNLVPTGDLTGPTRFKGPSEQLRLHRKTEAGSEQLEDGARAAEHDLILLQYQTDEQGYGVILSVDGRGTITKHLPESGNRAAELELRRSHLLGYSYELDDAPRWEVFFFVTSSSPFAIDSVVRAVEESLSFSPLDSVSGTHMNPPPSLNLHEGFRVSRFTLIKDGPHEN